MQLIIFYEINFRCLFPNCNTVRVQYTYNIKTRIIQLTTIIRNFCNLNGKTTKLSLKHFVNDQ